MTARAWRGSSTRRSPTSRNASVANSGRRRRTPGQESDGGGARDDTGEPERGRRCEYDPQESRGQSGRELYEPDARVVCPEDRRLDLRRGEVRHEGPLSPLDQPVADPIEHEAEREEQ